MKFIIKFFQPLIISFLLDRNILLSNLFSNTFNLHSLNTRDQVSHPYRTTLLRVYVTKFVIMKFDTSFFSSSLFRSNILLNNLLPTPLIYPAFQHPQSTLLINTPIYPILQHPHSTLLSNTPSLPCSPTPPVYPTLHHPQPISVIMFYGDTNFLVI
jgi:hypothetical protein